MGFEIRLREERLKRNWPQTQVAEKIGVSPQVVCDWEKGRVFPSYTSLVKLEDLFNMTHRELFEPIKK